MMKWILVSVFEREIQARGFETHEEAREEMMNQFREEFERNLDFYDDEERIEMENLLDHIYEQTEYNDGDFGFDGFSAYSNPDGRCKADWKIFSTGEIWW